MAFYYGTRLDAPGRRRLFGSINSGPTLYEAVMLGLPPATAAGQNGFDLRTRPGAQAVCPCAPLWRGCAKPWPWPWPWPWPGTWPLVLSPSLSAS